MGQPDNPGSGPSSHRLKVERLIAEYDLEGLGAELERRWTAEDADERASLRDLAGDVNRRLLATTMAEADMQPLDGEIENLYRLLTVEDVSDADRTRARRRLEREGVDVATLQADFVTYQAVRTYLKTVRQAEYTAPEPTGPGESAEAIQRLRGRVTTVTENKLDQLDLADEIDLGTYRILVDVTVLCEACGDQYEVSELLERGRCSCGQPGNR